MSEASVITCPVRRRAISAPQATAVAAPDRDISYAELDRLISAASGGLREAGLDGERVGLYMPRGLDHIVLLWGLLRAGAVACPISTRTPAESVAPLLERAGCTALTSTDTDLLSEGAVPPEKLLDGPPASDGITLPLDRPATIVFTSGSTGAPKAAMHTLANHCYSALGSARNIPLGPGDRWFLTLPLYHVGGLSIIFRCLLAGATIALSHSGRALGEELRRLGATHASMVSTQLLRMLREQEMPDNVRHILLGAGEIPASLLREATARKLPVHTSYGLTEMASQVTTTSGSSPAELATSGHVLPYRELRISAEGEILVRGETLFAGYTDGGSPERPLDAEGWFHTGDLGELDAQGRLRVLGRRDNMFVSGGENIQPEQIERALLSIDGVDEAVVVPAPHPEFGRRPVAFLRTAGETIPGHLDSTLRRILPGFMIPDAFHPWPREAAPGMKPDRQFFERLARAKP